MATNSDFVVPATSDERRYAIFDVSSDKVGDHPYWEHLHKDWMGNPDNIAAFVEHMREFDIGSFNPRIILETKALAEQREHSLEPFAQWWLDSLQSGTFFRGGVWYDCIGNRALHEAFLSFCDQQRASQWARLSCSALGKKLNKYKICGKSKDRRIKTNEKVPASINHDGGLVFFEDSKSSGNNEKCREMGSLEEARATFIKAFKLPADIFT